jgi:DNA-binding NtrC family response regulator
MKKRVLIVDDESDIRSICKNVVTRSFSAEVVVAGSLNEAKEHLSSSEFDLALLDIHLPDGVGFELIPAIKERMNTCRIVTMTAYNQCNEEEKAREMGVDGFLGKPFRQNDLIRVLEPLIDAAS